jgi:hypothetical protein
MYLDIQMTRRAIFVKVNLLYFQCDVKFCILCLITLAKVSLRVVHRHIINVSLLIMLHVMRDFLIFFLSLY